MPAWREAKAQPKLKRLPWCDGQMIRDQTHPRARRFLGRAFQRARRQAGQQHQGEKGGQEGHGP
jgi:hypothetical protein